MEGCSGEQAEGPGVKASGPSGVVRGMKQFLGYAALAAILFFVIKNPVQAADFLKTVFGGIGTFIASL
jgi:hypothetical protein